MEEGWEEVLKNAFRLQIRFFLKKSNNIICGCHEYMNLNLELCRKTASFNFVSKNLCKFFGDELMSFFKNSSLSYQRKSYIITKLEVFKVSLIFYLSIISTLTNILVQQPCDTFFGPNHLKIFNTYIYIYIYIYAIYEQIN